MSTEVELRRLIREVWDWPRAGLVAAAISRETETAILEQYLRDRQREGKRQ